MYSIVVSPGVDCWVVLLKGPDSRSLTTLGSRRSEEAAVLLANDIRNDVKTNRVVVIQ